MKLREKNFSIVGISHYEGSKKVTIGDTVQNIMSGAFWRTAIEEIVIPDTVKEMGVCRLSDAY